MFESSHDKVKNQNYSHPLIQHAFILSPDDKVNFFHSSIWKNKKCLYLCNDV